MVLYEDGLAVTHLSKKETPRNTFQDVQSTQHLTPGHTARVALRDPLGNTFKVVPHSS